LATATFLPRPESYLNYTSLVFIRPLTIERKGLMLEMRTTCFLLVEEESA
jgi:hypothetical protein